MNIFLCYPKCSTCKKAQAFLDSNHVNYSLRDIKLANPTASELTHWISLSGKKPSDFFNKSGLVYKDLQLKDKLSSMSDEEQIHLLSTNGMLVKRPLFVTDEKVYIGFKEENYEELV